MRPFPSKSVRSRRASLFEKLFLCFKGRTLADSASKNPDLPPSKWRSYCLISNLSTSISLFLACALVTVGSLGFALFLSTALNYAGSVRETVFEQVSQSVSQLVRAPTVIVDSVSSSFQVGFLNLSRHSNETFDEQVRLTFSALNNTMGSGEGVFADIQSLIMFSSTTSTDAFLLYMMSGRETGHRTMKYERQRVNGKIDFNATQPMIARCVISRNDGRCADPEEEILVPYDPDCSIGSKAGFETKPTYVPPYVFCPNRKVPGVCDIFLAYVSPIWNEDHTEVVQSVGNMYISGSISSMLASQTPSSSTSFLVDAATGYMIASSNPDVEGVVYSVTPDGSSITQLLASTHPDGHIRQSTNHVLNSSSLTSLYDSLSFDNTFVDFSLRSFAPAGADWLLIITTPFWYHLSAPVTYGVLTLVFVLFSFIVTLICGGVLHYCLHTPLKRMGEHMEQVMRLDFSLLKRKQSGNGTDDHPLRTVSIWSEIYELERRFWYLVKKLREYSAFLPRHLREKEKLFILSMPGERGEECFDENSEYENGIIPVSMSSYYSKKNENADYGDCLFSTSSDSDDLERAASDSDLMGAGEKALSTASSSSRRMPRFKSCMSGELILSDASDCSLSVTGSVTDSIASGKCSDVRHVVVSDYSGSQTGSGSAHGSFRHSSFKSDDSTRSSSKKVVSSSDNSSADTTESAGFVKTFSHFSLVWVHWDVDECDLGSKVHASRHAIITGVIDRECKRFRGTCLLFDETNWCIGINVAAASRRACSSHALNGCQLAEQLIRRLVFSGHHHEECSNPVFEGRCSIRNLGIGVATGQGHCEVLGSTDHKDVLCYGQIRRDARGLALRASMMVVPILVTQGTKDSVFDPDGEVIRLCPLDLVYLPDSSPTTVGKGRVELIYQLLFDTREGVSDGEWLYRFGKVQQREADQVIESAWDHLLRGRTESAIATAETVMCSGNEGTNLSESVAKARLLRMISNIQHSTLLSLQKQQANLPSPRDSEGDEGEENRGGDCARYVRSATALVRLMQPVVPFSLVDAPTAIEMASKATWQEQ